ncbi:F-box only protein 43 isoform X2 [Vanacampus margaritifer]
MQCTPESSLHHDSCKGQQCSECFDSGYSGLYNSPQTISRLDSCRSLASAEFSDTPKGNLRLAVTSEESSSIRSLHKDTSGIQRSSTLSWCETPKVCKRYASHRLGVCNAAKDVKSNNATSPCTGAMESPFDSFDTAPQDLTFSTLKSKQDLPLCVGKRRLLFSQVRTSTLEDATLGLGDGSNSDRRISLLDDFSRHFGASDQLNVEAPCLSPSKENSPSPVRNVLCTPLSTYTPTSIRFPCEDSGFSSLDKSQESSVDHDGSFQELLLSSSKGNSETANLSDTKRRSRLQRQHRLSTLKEGGSLSDEDPSDRKHQHMQGHSRTCTDNEVFVRETPRSVSSLKCTNATPDVLASSKQGYTTPLSESAAKRAGVTPSSSTSVNSAATPFKTSTSNLSLTPALQLIHTLCQQRAQMFAGQSPSLKEELRATAALANTAVMFGTTMPLAGLIGRKMGLGKVDILTELRKRNLRHILALIFSRLSAECVHSCGQVCKDWNEMIQQDKQTRLKREIYRREMEAALEAQSRTPSYGTPQSGTRTLTPLQIGTLRSSGKWDKFIEVAKTLFNDECLRQCPRCQHPAKCQAVKGEGVCTRADCAFQFCTACLCAFHGSKECGSQSVGRRKKDSLLPGSAQSKRNIRRLWK